MTIWAKVTAQFPGVHFWPDCPEDHPHAHLRNPHRHLFHVTVWIEQHHDNREIEFLEFKDWLNKQLDGKLLHRSCEMMAQDLINSTQTKWGSDRRVRVEVTEDGENGALVES